MPTYLCLQRRVDAPAETPPSPTQMDEMYAAFATWQDTFKDHIVDMGGRLGSGVVVLDESQEFAPLVEVTELVGGYMILEAPSLEEAAEIARACPGVVRPGSGVEVVEVVTP